MGWAVHEMYHTANRGKFQFQLVYYEAQKYDMEQNI